MPELVSVELLLKKDNAMSFCAVQHTRVLHCDFTLAFSTPLEDV